MTLRTLARNRVGRIYHLLRPYKHVENSLRGARLAKRHGYPSIDWDLQITKDNIIVVCHDNQPMLHGFFDPLRRINRDAKISDLTWAEVSRLRARNGVLLYRIQRVETMLAYAARIHLNAVLEPKANPAFGDAWAWEHIAAVADDVGCTVSVRALRWLGGVAHTTAARAAGIQAWLI